MLFSFLRGHFANAHSVVFGVRSFLWEAIENYVATCPLGLWVLLLYIQLLGGAGLFLQSSPTELFRYIINSVSCLYFGNTQSRVESEYHHLSA